MKTKFFWIGAIVLSLGIILLVYGYSEVQTYGGVWWRYEQQLQIAHILEGVGMGLTVMGVLITAYSILTKNKTAS